MENVYVESYPAFLGMLLRETCALEEIDTAVFNVMD